MGFKVTASVRQMVVSGPALTEMEESTFTLTVSLFTQPWLLSVTKYRVVAVGKTDGFCTFGSTILVFGDHKNVPMPFANS